MSSNPSSLKSNPPPTSLSSSFALAPKILKPTDPEVKLDNEISV
eukprot:CAMPEP_0175000914 /NCGR_PEP_ID=MMETSP0005-20121125/2850_1 /TAXON_ID=420556 /ORGANISM="Ochromonas sp., Strain CCMP1393" /LENGTH=43 /DNA_ID= /DNA_START= /DNA_END= /DNA_ORIENTATION=